MSNHAETSDRTRAADDSAAAGAAVAGALARLSGAWRNRRYDELETCFDERIVMALPGLSGRVQGRGPLVDSYREFMERSVLTAYEEQPPAIDVFGDTAIASYRWDMGWMTQGVSNHSAGCELFVLRCVGDSRDSSAWRAVWRTMMLDSGEK